MGLGPGSSYGRVQVRFEEELKRAKMDIKTKDEFIFFMQRACEDTCNDCYIELYNILLRAFISADKDFDGQVSEDQFRAIDENGDGGISFDEWLNFAYTHYQTQKLPVAFDKEEKDAFVKSCKDSANTGSDAYK